jgi:hypothetical protein
VAERVAVERFSVEGWAVEDWSVEGRAVEGWAVEGRAVEPFLAAFLARFVAAVGGRCGSRSARARSISCWRLRTCWRS